MRPARLTWNTSKGDVMNEIRGRIGGASYMLEDGYYKEEKIAFPSA